MANTMHYFSLSWLNSLGLAERIASFIEVEQSLPAAGQGAVGIECRVDDEEVKALLAPLAVRPRRLVFWLSVQ